MGEVAEPGAYDISSLSTPLNALFAAGGITQRGSLRRLKHYRGKQLIEEVDAYELLLHGVSSEVQSTWKTATPCWFRRWARKSRWAEWCGGLRFTNCVAKSSLGDVLDLAGGILPAAALRHIEVQRLQAHEKRTMLTLNLSPDSNSTTVTEQLSSFKIRDGDQIHIFPIASYNEQAIYLQGHVLRPGRYSYHDGMRLTDLLASYRDLLPEPAGHYAEIVRLNAPDFRPSVESFDLASRAGESGGVPKVGTSRYRPRCSAGSILNRRPLSGLAVRCVHRDSSALPGKRICVTRSIWRGESLPTPVWSRPNFSALSPTER